MADIPASEDGSDADGGLRLALRIAQPRFGITLSWRDRALILWWLAETEISNVFWERLVVLRLGWPPYGKYECFREEGT